VILGHISRENNLPELAVKTACSSLSSKGFTENRDYILAAARPRDGRMMVL